ncbi:conserved Plasmodium protein, unknown function [Plasmodium knowlesi strain H]|uniref:Sec16 Sec23-binding domain-containing protein n=3 Tax=Plasmodium knowlesi TaxID=5850 RepID=A0A5K1UTT9_PLAKH|nr:protein transport protein SEC16, putative [Plasmodium knowlesi strain H]OTN64861.1 Uncharacterized protein PKNOH_S120136400 [Plasmodium knowlesi]CAA9988223.1 protein transport protein SEC16, putative [Plasmodium knowlesi strain H]SBO20150.1 conserved Plasmodium protein, unknown function [Plasmodium knowlesi strain H]SBO20551.1 conserved Plasmodium protein, unknown function [Plasmodium knowlesi strain H]VVS77697.1 protein transport protein SEC16, putative [Plasmodium knowlesi strain H]|eukprot:XP_002259200.1 hypothetical protein, conserved in Plasmodium species [Plasmodium knowlesi strain H]
MEEHLFSYENIFRSKDLNIDEEIRAKNRPPDEGEKGEKGQKAGEGDTSPGGVVKPSEANWKGNPVETVEEESTEVTSMTNVVNATNVANATKMVNVSMEGEDAIVHINSQRKSQSKKKIKNDISSLFADSSSEVMGPMGKPSRDNSEINFWFSGKGTTAGGEVNERANSEADRQVGEKDPKHDNSWTTPIGNNPDGATNVKCRRSEDGDNCGIQNGANGVDISIGGCNEEKHIRNDGGDVPDWTPQVISSDLVRDVNHLDDCKNGSNEEGGEGAPRGGTSKTMEDKSTHDNVEGGTTIKTATTTTPSAITLCFGTNGTICYTKGRKIMFAPLICVLKRGIRTKSEGSHVGPGPTCANHSDSIGTWNNRLQEQLYAVENFPGPFSRRTDKVDKKVINFLRGHIKINEEKYGSSIYEYTQKNSLYNYLLNIMMRSPHVLDFNLKEVRVDRSAAKRDESEKGRNVVSYFVESSRDQGDGPHSRNGYQGGRSDYPSYHHDCSGILCASENNPRRESLNQDEQRGDSTSDVGEKGTLYNNRTDMDKFEITGGGDNGRETEKREFPCSDIYQGDNGSWHKSVYCRETSSFNPSATWSDAKGCKKKMKKVFVHNEQYEFNDLVDPNFINAFSKMGAKEKITREDIYLEYYHLCIYNSEEATKLCVEKNLFKHFFLILKKYNNEKYKLMLSKYIRHLKNSMDHDIEITDGMKNIFRIYNPSVHNDIVKESFVFLISLLNKESITFEKNILIKYWYSFYVLIYHNFVFQFEENELNYEEYKDDIHIFFSFLIKQLYMHGRVTESQFLYLQLYGNPCVFNVATQGELATYLDAQNVQNTVWGGPHFDVLTFQMCEIIEYLNRSNEDNFFYEDLIRHKIEYAFTLLELGVLELAKKYIEIIYYYVDVIRSQKKNYYLVHMYESLLGQAKYVLPSLRLQNGSIFSTNWTTSNEDFPEGGVYNYKVISSYQDLQHAGEENHPWNTIHGSGSNELAGSAIRAPPPNEQISQRQKGSGEGDSYHVPFHQKPSQNNVTLNPFEVKNPSGLNSDHAGSTHQGVTTGRISTPFKSNPGSSSHVSVALMTNQNEHSERNGSFSHFSFSPPHNNVGVEADQSNIHHDVANSRTSITPMANVPYPTNDRNSFSSTYHPAQMVVSGEGAEYTPVERGITYQQYNGAYQNESVQGSYFYRGGDSMVEGAITNNIPGGGNSTATSFEQISNTCNGGYNGNWGGDHVGGVGTAVWQDNFVPYYGANWNVAYPTSGSFNHTTHHAVQQVPHQSSYPSSSNNYPAEGAVPYGGNAKQPEQSGKSGPPQVTEKNTQREEKKVADQPHEENNMDLINIGKSFISGFFSNIKEKIKKVEQAEEEEEENLFYYDYEKKRWRERGVTSDEEEERERQKMQREMEMKNVTPPPQTENPSNMNKKNPLNITDVRSRYVDYFN